MLNQSGSRTTPGACSSPGTPTQNHLNKQDKMLLSILQTTKHMHVCPIFAHHYSLRAGVARPRQNLQSRWLLR